MSAISHDEPSHISVAGFPGFFSEGKGERREPPILLVHGASGSHQNFNNYLSFFSASGFDCYALSRRGRFGLPPENAQGVRFQDYLEDTLRVLDALDQQPIVIGHSLGGLLAQKLAERGRCHAAVLLASAPAGMLTAQPGSLRYFLPVLPAIVRGRPFRLSSKGYSYLALNRVPEGERKRIVAGFVAESGIVFRQMMMGAVRVDASRVRCPILCIGGMEDQIISRRMVRSMGRKYECDVREFADHAHWLQAEPK